MKRTSIRVAVGVPPIRVADTAGNARAAVTVAREAAAQGAGLLVLPALTLTAATAGALFTQPLLAQAAEEALAAYIRETADLPLLSLLGLPVAADGELYDCAAAVSGGRLLGLVARSSPDQKYFSPAPTRDTPVSVAGFSVFLSRAAHFPLPSGGAVAPFVGETGDACGADLIAILGASPEIVRAEEKRRAAALALSESIPVAYANAGEGESGTDAVYAGHSLLAAGGRLLGERAPFAKETLAVADIPLGAACAETVSAPFPPVGGKRAAVRRYPFLPADPTETAARCEKILAIQAAGLAGRYTRAYAKSMVLGISGGLDSTLAVLVAVRAADRLGIGRDRILAVTMPCFGTTARTKGNAEELCEALGVRLRTVDIHAAVRQHFADIGHREDDYSVVYENAQARERTQILMDLANGEGGIVVGTGDLSELALGWATYNGDHMSNYGVNGGIPKTLVRTVVTHAAEEAAANGRTAEAAILRDILATPVSPELLPPKDGEIAQKTEGIVGPYELHDFFLYYFIHDKMSPEELLSAAEGVFGDTYDGKVIAAWLRVFLRRFFSQQFKRSCLPDGPKVGSVALSPRTDWQMPSDAAADAWLSALDAAVARRGWQ